ncbi:hypothetical protein ACFW5X_32740 [Streptomyces albogriseolus]|uniref:hypothetical protein n=1 Tax=Streptomyces TaxID=1883 RepID=UPI002A74B08B|nr:hypothetical protein [Streptomyces sp. CL7]WPP33907.1 hypothetical protein SJH97_33335 [Streptomyces sp. CL7]
MDHFKVLRLKVVVLVVSVVRAVDGADDVLVVVLVAVERAEQAGDAVGGRPGPAGAFVVVRARQQHVEPDVALELLLVDVVGAKVILDLLEGRRSDPDRGADAFQSRPELAGYRVVALAVAMSAATVSQLWCQELSRWKAPFIPCEASL